MKNKGRLLPHGAISSFRESTQPQYTYVARGHLAICL